VKQFDIFDRIETNLKVIMTDIEVYFNK